MKRDETDPSCHSDTESRLHPDNRSTKIVQKVTLRKTSRESDRQLKAALVANIGRIRNVELHTGDGVHQVAQGRSRSIWTDEQTKEVAGSVTGPG